MPKKNTRALRRIDAKKSRFKRRMKRVRIHDDYGKSILRMANIPKPVPVPKQEPSPLEVAIGSINSEHDLLEVMGTYYKEQKRRRKKDV